MPTRFVYQCRRGTTEQWDKTIEILKNGEIGIEDCGGGRRGLIIGNGVDLYTNLPKIYLHEVMTKTIPISLPLANWAGEQSPYSQVVTINGITEHSKIDLQPTPEQLTSLQDSESGLVAVNDNCVVTVYAIGYKPTSDMTIQATITEVEGSSI